MRGARFLLLLAGFAALAWILGVIAALPLFMLAYMLVERVKPLTALAVAGGTGLVTWFVFVRLLSLPWPAPLWNVLGV